MARFFIDRPIFATVLALVIVIIGLIACYTLPIAEYPEIVPPTIVVNAKYPGASPQVIADTVATPLEQEINGVERMLYMASQSTSDGQVSITITFQLGTDLDKAQVLVQNRVAIAEPRLPETVRRLGITTQKSSPDLLLTPGLFARVRVPAGDKYKALMLPPEALGSDLSQQFVFVVDAQNLAQYRKVTPGPIIDGLRVIRDGLQPDDWVIVKGVQRAKTGAKVDPIKPDSAGAPPTPPATPSVQPRS